MEEARRQAGVRARDGETALAVLRRVHDELDAEIVLVFDQFEELFIHFRQSDQRAPVLDFLAACHAADELPVKILVSLRSDFLYLIHDELAGHVPEPLLSTKLTTLRRLDALRAEEVLCRSA